PIAVEDVFFRVLPIVLSLAFSTMFSSTTFSSSRRKLQRANPSGAGEQVRAINFASAAPSKIRGRAEFGLYLRVSAAAIPSSTSRRRVRPILLMLVSNAAEIALSPQPSPASDTSAFNRMRRLRQRLCRMLARADHRLQPFALLGAQLPHIFLDRDLPARHESPPSPHRRDRDSEKHCRFNDAGD